MKRSNLYINLFIFLILIGIVSIQFFKVKAQSTPLLSSTLDDATSITTPTTGLGSGASINTNPVDDFVTGQTGQGIRVDADGEYVRFVQTDGATQNIELDQGTVDFWYQPSYNHTDGLAHRIFGVGIEDQPGSIGLYKRTSQYGNDLYVGYKDALNVFKATAVASSRYSWTAGQWVHLRVTWDGAVPTGVQNIRIYINDIEPSSYKMTSTGPFSMPSENPNLYIYVGAIGDTGITASGVIDEFSIYPFALAPTQTPTSTSTPTPTIDPLITPTATSTPAPTNTPTPTPTPQSGINLVNNPGFENGKTSWVQATGGLSITGTGVHSGIKAQQIAGYNLGNRYVYQDVPVDESRSYSASAWIKTSTMGQYGSQLKIIWLSRTGVPIVPELQDIMRIDTIGSITDTNNWTFVSDNLSAPIGSVVARVQLITNIDYDNIAKGWYDDVSLIDIGATPVDTTPPEISIKNPVNNTSVSYKVTLKSDVRDNRGATSIQYYLDSNPIGPLLTQYNYEYDLDLSSLNEGMHNISAIATDAVGNQSSDNVNVNVSNTRPNIVFVLTDDQRYDTMDFMPITTARLGTASIKFNNAFVSTSLCCPSRSSILTGKYAHNHNVYYTSAPNGGAISFDDNSTIATWLNASGYRTSLIGKYLNAYGAISTHIAPGWDDWRVMIDNELFYNYQLNENGTPVSYGANPQDYSTDVIFSKAVGFINTTPSNQPLFLYVAPIAPHYPYTPASQDIGSLNGLTLHRPPSFNEQNVTDKPNWVKQLPLMTQSSIDNNDAVRQQQLESLQAVDRGVAALVDSLEQSGRMNNTIFVYTSDNGFMWGEHRIVEDKLCTYEECGRVPLWITGPGIISRSEDKFVQNVDFAPTFAAWAGIQTPTNINGLNMVPLIENPSVPWRTELLFESWGHYAGQKNLRGFSAVRNSQYVYAEYYNGNKELYDFSLDPYQLTNVVNQSSYTSVVSNMQSLLQNLKSQ